MSRDRRKVSIVGTWLQEDARRAWQRLLVGVIGGSWVTPRVLRHLAYRTAGMRTDGPNVFPALTVMGPAANVAIGRHTMMNAECYVDAAARVDIGAGCLIGPRVMFLTSDHPRGPDGRPQTPPVGRPITVGDRVWIGAAALLCPGVTVGDDVVIAAGSVVTRDCAPRGVYAGSPARRIKDLDITEEVSA